MGSFEEIMADSVTLNIHFGDDEHCKLKVYKGTSVEDIIANIRLIVNNDTIQCVDKDKNFIALSSSMPNGTDVFVKDKPKSIKSKASKPQNDDMKTQEIVPSIYGYADRAGAKSQKYSFDASGCGGAIIFSNITKNGCCNIGNMLNPNNGIFAAPISGIYSFTVSAWLKSGNHSNAQLWFNLNGKRQQTFSSPINSAGGGGIFAGTLTTYIHKSDYIDFRMYEPTSKGSTKEILENFHHTFVRWTLIRQN